MKNFFKSLISLSLAVLVLFGLSACSTPLAATTVSDEKSIVNGVSTNGGTTLIHGEYLYFINGTKTNDGSSSRGTTQGAICRVKYSTQTGKVDENSDVEVVVSDLVGFEDGSINIFGDFLYYATPCADVNYQGTALYSKTEFKRYDLVNGNAHHIYTTSQNNSSETTSYAYYVVGEELYLLIYENVSKVLTSIKIGDSNQIIYQISNVESCVFSDTNGKSETAGSVDANNFVFYTIAPTIAADGYEEGAKVYKTLPNTNSSEWMGNLSADMLKHNNVAILSIKSGKLIYSDESKFTGDTFIYAQEINEESDLEFNSADIISYNPYSAEGDMILFDEQTDGSISIVAYSSSSYQIVYIQKESGENVPHTIINFGEETDIDFVGKCKVSEAEENEDGEVIATHEVEYLLYTITNDSKVSLYKIEIKRDGVIATSPKLEELVGTDNMIASNGLILAETIENIMFVVTKDDDGNAYMHMVDISKEIDNENNKLNIIKK